MRIHAIRFQNLNSLRGGHELNLESGPLAEAGLFAITGPTGAGKSTILDAVTLALYARAARYGRETAEDMMSRGSGECSAAVEFSCESGRYTAKWLLRRARGRADGNFQPLKHELSQDGVIIEDKTRGVIQKVEEFTGLDYERFLRSVLLAQGQFAAFLRAARDERAELLERITGSHIYSELGALAYHISTGHTKEIEHGNIRLGAVTLLPEEERAEISGRLASLSAELASSEEKRAVLAAKVAAAKRAAQWDRQKEEYAAATARHTAALQAFAPEDARLAQHAATAPYSDALSALGECERAAQRAAAAKDDAASKAEAARAAAATAAGAALAVIAKDEAATEEEQRGIAEAQRRVAAELAGSQQWLAEHAADAALAEKLPELSAAAERVMLPGAQHSAAEKKCQAARHAAAHGADEAKQAAAKSSSANQLAEMTAREATAAKAALATFLVEPWTSSEQLEREVQRLGGVAEALQRMTAAHSGLTEQQAKFAALTVEVDSLQARAGTLSQEDRRAREKLESAQQTESLLQELVRQEQLIRSLDEHRAHLEEGKPCPLCGAAEHPWADPALRPATDSAEARLKQHQKEQRGLTEAARKSSAVLGEAEKTLAAAHAQQLALQDSMARARQLLEKEWRAHSPDTECSASTLRAAEKKTAETCAALSALAEQVRAATERERAAGKAAGHAENEAKICHARAEAAERHAATVAGAVKEAEDAMQSAVTELAGRKKELQTAFLSAGEPDAMDEAAALLRVKSRDRAWRGAMDARADMEKRAVILQHGTEKCAQHAKTLADRRRETEEAVARASLTVARQPAPEIGWNEVNAGFARAIADSHAAEKLAVSLHVAAQKAAEHAAEQDGALTAALAGSSFENVAALRAAQLDATVLQSLTIRRDGLREAAVRLDEQRESLAREAAALQEEWRRIADAEAPEARSVPGASPVESGGGERPGRIALPATDSSAELDEALATLTTQTNSLRTERGAQQQRLDTDNAARARQAAALAELEQRKASAAPWARLAALIGSADGDKFSRYAQSITLDHLTALANARLAQLCDRYRLVRCGAAADLQLRISDAWQADAVRPMESLSGGETFLVSLALALGLSELAGRGTRIGTLFIDEGFGTLDSAALDIALSALEGLRAGHSTVGIISHVEALKARLTTQVEVTRGPGGWSTLAIKS